MLQWFVEEPAPMRAFISEVDYSSYKCYEFFRVSNTELIGN